MAQTPTDANVYFVPAQSKWPFVGSIAMMVTMVGVASWLNDASWGRWTFYIGIAMLVLTLFWWFSDVVRESQAGHYNRQVDGSFRMGMVWFIFSEVMFFGAFFGALFYAPIFSVPWLGGEGHGVLTHQFIWENYNAAWGASGGGGPGKIGGSFQTIAAWGLPLLNTLLLLSSGVTITIAHHALKAGHRKAPLIGLGATVLLGRPLLFCQPHESPAAYSHS